MRTIRGVDVAALGDQFDRMVPNRVLLLDGDGAAYRSSATVKTLDTAVRRFVKEVLTDQFLTGAEEVRVHLTGQGGQKALRGLYPTRKPYQGNRKGKPKPALLEPLRELLGTERRFEYGFPENIVVHLHRYWEADDALVQDGVLYGDRSVTKSDDKDLRLTPAPFYESEKGKIDVLPEGDRFGWIDAGYTPSLSLRVKGHGTKFFWAQMLMGDTADHVRGLERWEGKLIAEAGTLDVLGPVEDENEAANRILWAYAKIGQDALAEAQVLWLRRSEQDCAYRYLCELDLDKNLRTWLDQLYDYHQAIIKQKLEERDAEASEDPT